MSLSTGTNKLNVTIAGVADFDGLSRRRQFFLHEGGPGLVAVHAVSRGKRIAQTKEYRRSGESRLYGLRCGRVRFVPAAR